MSRMEMAELGRGRTPLIHSSSKTGETCSCTGRILVSGTPGARGDGLDDARRDRDMGDIVPLREEVRLVVATLVNWTCGGNIGGRGDDGATEAVGWTCRLSCLSMSVVSIRMDVEVTITWSSVTDGSDISRSVSKMLDVSLASVGKGTSGHPFRHAAWITLAALPRIRSCSETNRAAPSSPSASFNSCSTRRRSKNPRATF
eukprot:Stramenopile-MAST_4_protein_6676